MAIFQTGITVASGLNLACVKNEPSPSETILLQKYVKNELLSWTFSLFQFLTTLFCKIVPNVLWLSSLQSCKMINISLEFHENGPKELTNFGDRILKLHTLNYDIKGFTVNLTNLLLLWQHACSGHRPNGFIAPWCVIKSFCPVIEIIVQVKIIFKNYLHFGRSHQIAEIVTNVKTLVVFLLCQFWVY